MGLLSSADVIRAFPHSPATARRLNRAIDLDRDGQLEPEEIAQALRGAKAGQSGLRDTFAEALGKDFATAVPTPGTFAARVRAEAAAQQISEPGVMSDMVPLCKDRRLSVRDASDPVAYRRSAEYVARRMAEAGLEPLGDAEGGGRGYLQSFWWEPSFNSDKTPIQSWNVVGRIPGKKRADGKPNDAVVLIGHLDNLSQAEKDYYRRKDGRDLSEYEGASDNASAVVTLLEIARALKDSPLEHDVIFLVPSGEEDGLKGSEAFVRACPVPLDQLRAAINFEMVGFEQHLLFGGDTQAEARANPLHARAWKVAERTGAKVVPGIAHDAGEGWWRRSDHFPFHAEGIPAVMVLGNPPPGVYHTAEDKLENCDPARIRDAARFALRLAADLCADAQAPERRAADKQFKNHYGGRVWPGAERPRRGPALADVLFGPR
jgi:hypothetical protein